MFTSDRELTGKDVLGLSSAEATVGFLASLGYRTDARTVQAPANLGITAETLVHQIRRLELLADHEGLLQVYLVELTSVTVAATRALARAFRTLNVQFPLLILTHDYERLDFVLVEKVLPGLGDDAGPMGQKQVAIRPRILTVNRRDPGRVELRVLRRFTYTEADPIAQGVAILEVLRKNAKRLGVSLNDPRLIGRVRGEYEKSLAVLLPIKRRLAVTDWLIDQLVYRLYGLTEEEIRIVEGVE